ncbi:MAG TPA: RICIN domain-containing protein, partial [Candidatus Paceibacterota bacterium]|nr:RICIN domain-containing protein [Candidatus Paceibacterota bacterium]
VDPWYQSGANRVYPDRWAAAIQACQRYYNRSIFMVEGFNEPDFTSNNEGSAQDLYNIFGYLQASTNFPGTLMAGGSTLNNDLASTWYKPVASRAAVGTTHCLAGSASTYVSFIQTVVASNGVPYNPELHNVMEAMMGVEYGLKGGIWWGTAELTRGSFVKACQGKRLAYSDDLPKWTAASVYRGTNGAVQAFVGASERMATTTSYRFFSRYRDVFYDGNGPQREYTVTIVGGSGYQVGQLNLEKMVNINWGADVQPAIGGRYAIVNRYSGKALEVPGAKTNYGVVLDQITYTGASNQLWDVYPISTNFGGDMNYFTLSAAHSGATADNSNFSYNDGNSIIQWGTGGNVVEHWYFEYVGNGYFKIRNRWSGKCLDLSSQSTGNGITIAQWSDLGRLSQQWRLVPAGAAVEFVAPAPPASLIATPNAASTQLNWAANTETDLAGYTVLRAANSGGPYEIVARGLTNNSFTDKSANRLGTYFYVVKAADRSLNTSGNSTEVSVAPTCGPALIARYAFDGSTNDSSGNANHAIVTMGSPGFTSGKYGSAMNLNGTDQYTMLPAEMFASVTNFTIAAWVNWNGGSAWQRIFDFGNDTTQNMFLTPNSGNGTLRFAITTNGGGAEQIVQTASALPTAQWIHVAVTYNGTTAIIYTNGVLAASGAVSISPAAFNPAINNLGASQYPDPYF